jgi:hypothetical protein
LLPFFLLILWGGGSNYFRKTWYADIFGFFMPTNVQKKLRSEKVELRDDQNEMEDAIYRYKIWKRNENIIEKTIAQHFIDYTTVDLFN